MNLAKATAFTETTDVAFGQYLTGGIL